ncbi:A24 family peptidase [Microbacterium aoyamense]|uniref:Prepilin leader peptidase/N-methyltransferase n=1 Tax=Microbacterium aoyamense TaxID=344166 RepID=A0ABP5B9G9_9MICO|nr:A24 family peptidase [Microbacterium aoyamense]
MPSAVLIFLLLIAALLGLVIGSFLNVVIFRVPAGIPLTRESRCPHCDTAVRWWQNIPVASWIALRGRCAKCGATISPRYPLVESLTAVAFAGIVWWLTEIRPEATVAATVLVTIAFLYLAAVSITLSLIDLDTHRLPNSIVLPSYAVGALLFTAACAVGADWWSLGRAVAGAGALFAFYFVLRLVRPDGMGGGDVKLAGVLGLYLGWLGWPTLVVGATAAFLLGGVFGVALLVLRRAGRGSAIPFGPWMILGAWVGAAFSGPLARWYLGLLGGAS